jgi:hypothetical protein
MTPADADVVASRSADIARAASFYGYSLDGSASGSWSYEQAVCPLAPGHILLKYWGTEPDGPSSFSAVVPRDGGVVRIVPLLRGGTAPSVTPRGAHSYAVFNSITAGDGGLRAKNVDLSSSEAFVWGLCYAALFGGERAIAQPDRELRVFSATEPTVHVGAAGEIGLSFTVRDDRRDYSVWRLEFSRGGLLVHADRERRIMNQPTVESAAKAGVEPLPPVAPLPSPNVRVAAPAPAGAETQPAPAPAPASEAPVVAESAPPALAAQRADQSVPDALPAVEHPVPDGPAPVWRPVLDSAPLVSRPVPRS